MERYMKYRVPLKNSFRKLTKKFLSIQGGKSSSAAGLREHFDNAVATEKIESRTKWGFLEVPCIVCRKMAFLAILISVFILPAFSGNDDSIRFQGSLFVDMASNSTALDEIIIENNSEKTVTDISITHEETSGIRITIDPAYIPVLHPGEQIELSISISNTFSNWSKSIRVEPRIYLFLNGSRTDQTHIIIRIDPPSFPWIVTILGLCIALLAVFILIYLKFSKQEARRKYD